MRINKSLTLVIGLFSCLFAGLNIINGGVSALAGNYQNEIARVNNSNLSDDDLLIRSQNRILFPTDGCVVTSGSSSVCGNTPKEMYWSALSQQVSDPIKIAGIMGNLAAEGVFQPVLWEIGYSAPWDVLYNCGDGSCPFGVGSFGFTWFLGQYLHAVNDEKPDLLKYFQNRNEYGNIFSDELLEKIGKDEYAKLVDFEVKYALGPWSPSTTESYMNQNFATPADAAYWWMDNWERPGVRTADARMSAASKLYDEFKDFKCTASALSSSSTSSGGGGAIPTPDVTLIGDSIAVQAEPQLQEKFPGGFLTKVGSRHSTSGGACSGDGGGLDALRKIVSGSGSVVNQNASGECGSLNIDSKSLKDNVVWELGTNSNGATKETIEEVIKLIGKKKLFLVTPYNGNLMDGTDAIANMYREVANEHDNVYIVDWNAKVRENEGKYVTRDDGMAVHPTAEGRQLLADLISHEIEKAGDCVKTSSDNGEYPQYYQWDGPWAGMPYGRGTYQSSGCGPTSMAMLATKASGQEVLPTDVAAIAAGVNYIGYNDCSHDCMYQQDKLVGERYGFEVEKGGSGNIEAEMREHLKNGDMIHVVGDLYHGTSHYIGLYDIDENDNVHTADSADGNTTIPLSTVAALSNWFTIIKGGGGGNGCLAACEAGGKGSVDGGLDEKAAQKLVDYYKSDKVSADEWGLPFGKANCVSLSIWFAQALTSIGKNSNVSDNGNGVAHQVAQVGNLEEGNNPRPYSVFSVTRGNVMCDDGPCGHTGVVVGVNGDDIITIEAAYGGSMGEVVHRTKDYFENTRFGKSFVYLESILKKSDLESIVGR